MLFSYFLMQSYPTRALDRKLQVDWARDAREGPRVLMSLKSTKFRALLSLSLHSSPSSSKLLSMTSYVASPLSLPSPFRCHSSSKKQRNPLMKKILGLQAPMELTSCGNHILDLTSIGEKMKENLKRLTLNSHTSMGRTMVEQKLKRKPTLKSYGYHSYPKKDQGLGILGAAPSKPNDDKGKTIEKQPPKTSMQEKTSSIKCFKCLGRGHITSQCSTKKNMIMRSQDIYSSQDEATTSPSSSESEEAKGEESSEEIYPQEEGKPLMVKEECKEVSVSSKRLAKKERHFEIKTNIKEISPLKQPPHFLLCKKTLVSIVTPLRLEFIPQVKELLDEGLVCKSLNPCAFLVPKIAQLIELVRNHVPSWEDAQEMSFQTLPYFNILNTTNTYVFVLFTSVEEKSPEFQEPRNLRSILFKGEGMIQSYPAMALDRKLQVDWARDAREGPRVLMSLRSSFRAQNFVLFSPSPFIHLLLPPSPYPWPPMVTHLLLEVASPLSLPSPFRCHLSSKKQRNPLMKKILGLQAPMELTSFLRSLFAFSWEIRGRCTIYSYVAIAPDCHPHDFVRPSGPGRIVGRD
ncbi:hypothetical protein HKD37_18G050847 [Glycine soja]